MTAVQNRAAMVTAEIALDDIPEGEGRAVALGDEQVAVFRLRTADGETVVRAVSAVCPHLGGPIADGQTDAGKVICPLHLHTYDLTDGSSLSGQPALKVYPVDIGDRKVVVSSA